MRPFALGPVLLALLVVPACGGTTVDGPYGPAEPTELVVLTASQRLLVVRADDPGVVRRSVAVSGLAPGAELVAIGFDYAAYDRWDLYGVGTDDRLYRLDAATGAASPVGTGPFSPSLDGVHFAIACDTLTVGELHVFSDAGQHLVLSETTGAALDAGELVWAGDPSAPSPAVVAASFAREIGVGPVVLVADDARLLAVEPLTHEVSDAGWSPAGIPAAPDASLTFLYSFYDPPLAVPAAPSQIPPTERAYLATIAAGATTSRLLVSVRGDAFVDLGAIGGGERAIGLAGHDDF